MLTGGIVPGGIHEHTLGRADSSMGTKQGFKMAPALVSGTGAPYGLGPGAPGKRPPHALELTVIYNRKISSRPMELPPFVVRPVHPSSVVRYPTFPEME